MHKPKVNDIFARQRQRQELWATPDSWKETVRSYTSSHSLICPGGSRMAALSKGTQHFNECGMTALTLFGLQYWRGQIIMLSRLQEHYNKSIAMHIQISSYKQLHTIQRTI